MVTFSIIIVLLILTLLVSLQFYFNKNLFLKLVVVTYLFIISSVAYFSFDSYFGWPSQEPIKAMRVMAIIVYEPTPLTEGRIFVWGNHVKFPGDTKSWADVVDFEGDGMPRAYEIEYTKERGDDMQDAKKKLTKGGRVYIFDTKEQPDFGDGNQEGIETKKLESKGKGVQKNLRKAPQTQVLTIIDPRIELKKETN